MLAVCFLHLTESRSLKYIKSDNPNCDIKRQLRIDQVYNKLVSLGKNGRKFPENPKQLKKFCKYESIKMIISEKLFNIFNIFFTVKLQAMKKN